MALTLWMGLSEISGILGRLQQGFEQLGHHIDFHELSPHIFAYRQAQAFPSALQDIIQAEQQRMRMIKGYRRFWKTPRFLFQKYKNIARFIRYFKQYDAVIFIYGNSFYFKTRLVYFNDLFWLKLFGIKTIFLMVGSDSRPTYYDAALLASLPEQSHEALISTSNATRQNNQAIQRYAHYIISNVFSSYYFDKPFIPLHHIGNPAPLCSAMPPVKPKPHDTGIVHILHAPSNLDAKGSADIEKTIQKLIAAGYPIHFEKITGVPHHAVLEALQNCDFVIDQLYSDVPFSGFCAEAASLGKAIIVGSYIPQATFEQAYARLGLPPVLITHPQDLAANIIRLTEDRAFRTALGRAAHAYARDVISPRAVAARYVQLIQGNFPGNWWIEREAFCAPVPLGLSEDRMMQHIRKIAQSLPDHALENRTTLDAFCRQNNIPHGDIHRVPRFFYSGKIRAWFKKICSTILKPPRTARESL